MENDIVKIEMWLNETVRNRYFFGTDQVLKTNIPGEYDAAYEGLSSHLTRVTDRESYLKWVKVWKAVYSKLSTESRMVKSNRKTTRVGDEIAARNAWFRAVLRSTATDLIELRKLGKELAGERYAAERELVEP